MEQPNKQLNNMIRDFMGTEWYPPPNHVDSPIYKFDQSWDWILPVWKKLYEISHSKVFKNDLDYKLLLSHAEHQLITVNLDQFVSQIALIIGYYNSLT